MVGPEHLQNVCRSRSQLLQIEDYHAIVSSDASNLELMQAVMEHGVVIVDNMPLSGDSSVLLDFVNNYLGGMQKDPAREEPNWVIKKKAGAVSVSYAQERRTFAARVWQ